MRGVWGVFSRTRKPALHGGDDISATRGRGIKKYAGRICEAFNAQRPREESYAETFPLEVGRWALIPPQAHHFDASALPLDTHRRRTYESTPFLQTMRASASLITAFLAAITAAFASGPGRENDFGGRRVLLIGIDGCRADALRAAMDSGKAPALRKLAEEGCADWSVFAGGELGGATEQATSSGPGWSTILTGVWRNKHGVSSNKFEQHRIAEFPHFMRRIKDAKPSAWCGSLVDWPEIQHFIAEPSRKGGREFLDEKFMLSPDPAKKAHDWPELDAAIRDRAAALLRGQNPDALFVYFGQVDETGHAALDAAGKFSPDNAPYLDAIGRVDALTGDVLAALRARPHFAEEDWLILVTTDHGGTGTSHGKQSPEERNIWLLANGAQFRGGAVLTQKCGHSVVPPTVFQHLGLTIDPAWGWEEKPLHPPNPTTPR